MRLLVVRNATRSSPRRRSLTGGQSGRGSSSANIAGSQNRRKTSPIGVPGPTRVISSLSCLLSNLHLPRSAVVPILLDVGLHGRERLHYVFLGHDLLVLDFGFHRCEEGLDRGLDLGCIVEVEDQADRLHPGGRTILHGAKEYRLRLQLADDFFNRWAQFSGDDDPVSGDSWD